MYTLRTSYRLILTLKHCYCRCDFPFFLLKYEIMSRKADGMKLNGLEFITEQEMKKKLQYKINNNK